MDLFNGTTMANLNGNNLFPDSTILVNYGTSGYGGTWIHKLGDFLDVTSDMFNSQALHPGALNLDAASYYSLDSIEFYCIYERNLADPNIVDTLVFEVCVNHNPQQVYFGPGALPTNLGTDTVFFMHTPYSYQTNSLNLPNKQVYKVPLTHLTIGDSLPNGLHVIKLATTGLQTVNPGKYVFTAIGFVPGYTWVPNLDTITKKNRVLFISRKENDNQFPVYTKHDYNVSYIVPSDVRYNVAGSWNGYFIPSFAYMGSAPTYRYEHHLIYYKVSTSFNISSNYQNVSCYGGSNGSINLTVAGGTAPYTYLWSHGPTTQNVQNLSAGAYTVTITDADSSMAMRMFNITQPQPLQATVTAMPTTACGASDGSISVSNISGGTPSYSIVVLDSDSITQSISGLPAGIYTVKITDSKGCQMITVVAISESGGPAVSAVVNNVTCFGLNNGSISLTVSNNTGNVNYNWSSGQTAAIISNLSPGQFIVTITDDNCTLYETYSITQPLLLQVTGTINNASGGQANGSVITTVTGGTPNYSYAWSSGQITPNIGNLTSGQYTLTVTDSKGCTATETFEVISVGVNDLSKAASFNVYPNPVSDVLVIQADGFNAAQAVLSVFSVHGQLLSTLNLELSQTPMFFDFSEFATGFYFVELRAGETRLIRKVLK